MEYLACGVPIVATDIEAHRYVVNQTGGAILAKDDRPESLAAAIRTAIVGAPSPVDRSLLEETISWNKQAKVLETFLMELCSKRKAMPGL